MSAVGQRQGSSAGEEAIRLDAVHFAMPLWTDGAGGSVGKCRGKTPYTPPTAMGRLIELRHPRRKGWVEDHPIPDSTYTCSYNQHNI